MLSLLNEARPLFDGLLAACAALYALGALWFVRGTRRCAGAASAGEPCVSVVVAARDERVHIDACLQGLEIQDYPAEKVERIVVDDGSADGTGERVEERGTARLLRTGGEGKKAALSRGVEAARGEIVLSTDADCRTLPGWVRGMVACFGPDTGMVVGFSQIGAPGQARGARAGYEAVDFLCLMTCLWGSAGNGHPMAASGQNLAYRRSLFHELGGYEKVKERVSGDDVLLLQMARRQKGWKIAFCTDPATFVVHPPSRSWTRLLQQRTRWASNAPLLARLDPPFFAYMAATFTLSLLLVLSPLLVLLGGLSPLGVVGAAAAKWGCEYGVFRRGVVLSGRGELRRYFPLWAFLQPLHVVLVGALGPLGFFRWKGRAHRWGRYA